MHVGERLTGELVEADRGGRAIIFRAQLDNRPVAVKSVLVYTSSDFDQRLSVNTPTFMFLENFLTMRFVGILSRSCCVETSPTPEHPAVVRCGLETTPAVDDIRVDG